MKEDETNEGFSLRKGNAGRVSFLSFDLCVNEPLERFFSELEKLSRPATKKVEGAMNYYRVKIPNFGATFHN